MMYLMFIGASPGSTGGGIKTSTFGIMLATVRSMIAGRHDVEVWKRRIPRDSVRAAISLLFIASLWVQLTSLLLCYVERDKMGVPLPGTETQAESRPVRPLDYVFEEISAFGTVGLSTGVTPHLSPAGKIIIILSMFFGRLGPITIMLAIAQQRAPLQYHYPEDNVMVG
jgi:trk system potassium uptake protein TrkH